MKALVCFTWAHIYECGIKLVLNICDFHYISVLFEGESLKQDTVSVRGRGSALWFSQELNWNYTKEISFFLINRWAEF